MSRVRLGAAIVLAGIGVSLGSAPVHAQGVLDRIKQKVADKKEQLTDSVGQAVVDKATGAIECLAENSACIKKAFGAGKNVEVMGADGKRASPADSAAAVANAGGVPAAIQTQNAAAPPAEAASAPAPAFGEGVFLNYDFVPGDRVLFSEDFTHDSPGDFPRRLQLRAGNFEVASWQGQPFLRTNSASTLVIPLPELLPQRFTFEADYQGGDGWAMTVNFADPDSGDFTTASFNPGNGGLEGTGVRSLSDISADARRPLTHIAVMADGAYAKVYVNGVRVANVPNANLGRGKVLVLGFVADESTPAYITNIRVAAGGKPLYDAIMADGRVATHGILFDTGSDRLRAESKPTLDQIGQMLTQHADLKLTVEGHTDNAGSAASNQTLSAKRAAAVMQYLIESYHVAAGRLASRGYGASKPAASNDTPEGRQQNRRVELVKDVIPPERKP